MGIGKVCDVCNRAGPTLKVDSYKIISADKGTRDIDLCKDHKGIPLSEAFDKGREPPKRRPAQQEVVEPAKGPRPLRGQRGK